MLATMLVALLGNTALVQDEATTSRPLPKNSPALSAKELAGEYQEGGGMWRDVLRLSPDRRFTFTSEGGLGPLDMGRGGWRFEDGVILLEPDKQTKTLPMGLESRLIPIDWGRQRYLVAESRMLEFCDAIRRGAFKPADLYWLRHSSLFLLRVGDEHHDPIGLPNIPAPWTPYLHKPFTAKIKTVRKDRSFVVDRGVSAGLVLDTRLRIADPSGWRGFSTGWKVIAVTEDEALCIPTETTYDESIVKPGATLVSAGK